MTFHSLQHSAGSIMLAHGAQLVDVSAILGHSSVAITARIYAHIVERIRAELALPAEEAFDAEAWAEETMSRSPR